MDHEAIRLFKLAGELEGQGEMKEAVKTYKQAFRLREDVDVLYRKMQMLDLQKPASDPSQVATEPEQAVVKSGKCVIKRLPPELIELILAFVAQNSLRDYRRAQTAGRVFWIQHDSALFWEPMCRAAYEDAQLHYHKYASWYEMFRKRPAIRYDGVYIAVCKYFREGEPEGSSWFPPTIEVIYYRYLRFFPNGLVHSLLSNDPPTSALPFTDSQKAYHGSWRLDPETGDLRIATRGPVKHHILQLDLRVTSAGGKLHNKLKWCRYWYTNMLESTEGEYDLKNDRSFFFRRTPGFISTLPNESH